MHKHKTKYILGSKQSVNEFWPVNIILQKKKSYKKSP